MKIEGIETLAASRDRIYQILTDPIALSKALPGCEELVPVGNGTFQVKIKLGLGALSGSYLGTVKVSEQRPSEHLRLAMNSRGPWGFAEGGGTLTLTEHEGQTMVRYEGEFKVGGMIASIGQRLLEGVARMVVSEFFKNLATQAVTG